MKESERLQKIASQIKTGETMADIGTDHGFLPIRLYQEHVCPKVILTDISPNSLAKAVNDWDLIIGKDCPDASFRVGAGLEPLECGEVDTIVIAGMGGILMTKILGENLNKSHSFSTFILQPRSHVGYLRAWLLDHGFIITKEEIALEVRRYCNIIVAKPSKRAFAQEYFVKYNQDDFVTAELDYPLLLLESEEHSEGFLIKELRKQNLILDGISMDRNHPMEDVEQKNKQHRQLAQVRKNRIKYLLNKKGVNDES